MSKAIVIRETGGPEVMSYEEVTIGDPGPGEAKVRHTAIGVNFIDTYFRTGLYPNPGGLPFTPGNEAAGEVVAIGDGVTNVVVGDRVAYVVSPGSYAEERVLAADRIVKLPGGIDEKTAAAMMLKGMTAQYLLRQLFKVEAHHTVLFHAAAGGVGQIAGQWAKKLGCTIIGTAGSDEKCQIAKDLGYTHVINYRTQNFVEEVKEITGGQGVDVCYDSVGKDTYPGSLDCIKPRGMWVSFGNASGPVGPIDLLELSRRGSLFTTRPTLFAYIATREDLEMTANSLFDVVTSGDVKIDIGQTYPLSEAIQAHKDLEGRKTTGSTILLP